MVKVIVQWFAGPEVSLVDFKPQTALYIDFVERNGRCPGGTAIVADPCPALFGRERVHRTARRVHIVPFRIFEHPGNENFRLGIRETVEHHM